MGIMLNLSSAIELRHLRYFVAVVRERSFRAAASVVNISQPPLTRQVQQLEEVLGVQLLIRGTKGVEPTIAGAMFYTAACNILGLMARSEEHTSELQSLMRISYAVFCLKTKN